tara:strand:+ start:3241 stop:5529 length:2289 start_codon:yes stop_codon:yes gene_type:complete
MKLQLKRSAVLDGSDPKTPTAAQMEYGELAINYNSSAGPVLYTKDSSNAIIEIVPKLSTIVRTDQSAVQVLVGKVRTAATVSGDAATTITTKGYVDTVDATKLNLSGGTMTGNITWNSTQSFIGANVTGTLSVSTTGNAATATALASARTIGGTSFDGTANIDIAELNGLAASYYLNATNLNAGTVPLARLSAASTSVQGISQLSNATNSTSEVLAATPKAVKIAYDLADDALAKTGGTMTGVITFAGSQSFDPTKVSAGTLPSDVLAQAYVDGSIINDDISTTAGIALSKLATGALPGTITISTSNIVDGTIINTDISSTAAIAFSKLATGTLPSAIKVTSANITDLEIVDADVSNSAAITGTKIVGATTSVVGTVQLTSATNSTSETLAATASGLKTTYDVADAALPKAGGTMTGDIVFASSQAFNPTKLSAGPLPTNVTLVSANITDGTIVDADISGSAAITGTKIVPASTSVFGTVKLTDSPNTTSSTLAASATAVKAVYDLAVDDDKITIATSPPSNPNQGDLWWDSSPNIGNAFLWYEDGNSNQWVPLVPGTPEIDYDRVILNDDSSSQTMIGPLVSNSTIRAGSSNADGTARVVIDPGGSSNVGGNVICYTDSNTTDSNKAIGLYAHHMSPTWRFYVENDGDIYSTNTTINSISSERRLKDGIKLIDPTIAWNTIKDTPYYQYYFKGGRTDNLIYGPIVDEVPADMVINTNQTDEEGVIRTYNNSLLQARLFVALQQALKEIEILKAKVETLESS